MIKIENFEVIGWEHAIRGMRNPMNSWDRIDSHYCGVEGEWPKDECNNCIYYPEQCLQSKQIPYIVGPNDLDLMKKLANGGPVHAKYRRFITVYLDITAPLYWWKEFDTYKVGTVANSCSTMHKIHEKPFTMNNFSCEHIDTASIAVYPNDDGGMDDWSPRGVLCMTVCMLNECRNKYLETNDKKYWWQMIQLLPSSYNQKRTIMLNYEVLANIYEWRKNHKLDEWVEFCHWIESLPYSEIITGNPGTSIFYLCDRKKCENCNNIDCHHTSDINHAVNFEKSGHVYSEKVKTPDICPYWNYKEHKSIHTCNGCEEEGHGDIINGDRYCNIVSPTTEEE